MTLIPDELIDEIRDRIDIVAVIGEHVQLKKAGVNHKGLCPFHHEKTPSFHVNPVRKSFTCFGCSKKGDVFTFLREMQGKTFVEVVHDLAARAGVTIPERPQTPEEMARRSERGRLSDLNAVATAFFRQQLQGAGGQAGRAYLAGRGIGEQVAETFRLGLAPDSWDALAHHFEAKAHPLNLAVQLGLIAPRTKGPGFYDKFRNRLICPVILPAGEVVGFSGRTLGNDPEAPKYTNSPESPVYKKSNLLFGIHAARGTWQRKGRALLVEGNFDVIALHQAGFTEAVAPLGTALTGEQVELLRRMAPSVVLCLDGDSAGRTATLRAIPLLVHAGLEARVMSLPAGEDPDSFVRKHGAAVFEEMIGRARPAIEHFLDEIWVKTDHSPERMAAAINEAAPLIAGIKDETRRDVVVGVFSQGFGVEARIVHMAVRRAGQPGQDLVPAPKSTAPQAPPPNTQLNLLALLHDHPELFPESEQLGVESLLTDARLRDIYSAALRGTSFLDAVPPDSRDLGEIVARDVCSGNFVRIADPRRTLRECVRVLQFDSLQSDLERITRDLKDAERRGDSALAKQLLTRHVETRNKAEALKRRPEPEPKEDSR